MKAVSVFHPGGTRIANGEQTIEVRGWKPELDDHEDLVIVENHKPLRFDGDMDLNGRIVAIVKLKAVRPFTTADMGNACALFFEEGLLAWELTDVRQVKPPVGPVTATSSVFDLDVEPDQLVPCETPPKSRRSRA
jgi:ASCH domain